MSYIVPSSPDVDNNIIVRATNLDNDIQLNDNTVLCNGDTYSFLNLPDISAAYDAGSNTGKIFACKNIGVAPVTLRRFGAVGTIDGVAADKVIPSNDCFVVQAGPTGWVIL